MTYAEILAALTELSTSEDAEAQKATDALSKIYAPDDTQQTDDQKKQQDDNQAAIAAIVRETGAPTALAGIEVLTRWKASHTSLVEREVKLAEDEKKREAADRLAIMDEAIKAGKEDPGTAWLDGANGLPDRTAGVREPWASMKVADLKEHFARKKARTNATPRGQKAGALDAPAQGAKSFTVSTGAIISLTAEQLKICEETKCDPQVFAELHSRQGARTTKQPTAT